MISKSLAVKATVFCMATCEDCAVLLLSTDPCHIEEFRYRPELVDSPSSCPGCRTLLRGLTSFALKDLSRNRPHGITIRFHRRVEGDLLSGYIRFPTVGGYLGVVNFEFYTLPGKQQQSRLSEAVGGSVTQMKPCLLPCEVQVDP